MFDSQFRINGGVMSRATLWTVPSMDKQESTFRRVIDTSFGRLAHSIAPHAESSSVFFFRLFAVFDAFVIVCDLRRNDAALCSIDHNGPQFEASTHFSQHLKVSPY